MGSKKRAVNFAGMESESGSSVRAPTWPRSRRPLNRSDTRFGRSSRARSESGPTERYAREVRYQRRNVALAAVLTIPLMALSMLVSESDATRIGQAVLATPVVFALGSQFHTVAVKRLRLLEANMNTLVSIGSLVAWGYSMVALFAGEPVFFETSGMIITLILLGRFFEARAKGRASEAVSNWSTSAQGKRACSSAARS